MTRKHQSREYQRNAPIVRKQVNALHRSGMPAVCWRGGGLIPPGMVFDVGHLPGARGSSLTELAPEHRHRTLGCCEGNRRHGGIAGAMKTNRLPARLVHHDGNVQSWPL